MEKEQFNMIDDSSIVVVTKKDNAKNNEISNEINDFTKSLTHDEKPINNNLEVTTDVEEKNKSVEAGREYDNETKKVVGMRNEWTNMPCKVMNEDGTNNNEKERRGGNKEQERTCSVDGKTDENSDIDETNKCTGIENAVTNMSGTVVWGYGTNNSEKNQMEDTNKEQERTCSVDGKKDENSAINETKEVMVNDTPGTHMPGTVVDGDGINNNEKNQIRDRNKDEEGICGVDGKKEERSDIDDSSGQVVDGGVISNTKNDNKGNKDKNLLIINSTKSKVVNNEAKHRNDNRNHRNSPDNNPRAIQKKCVTGKRVSRTYRIHIGLDNPNKNCYLNSVIQVLFVCDEFRDKIIDHLEHSSHNREGIPNADFVRDLAILVKCMKSGDVDGTDDIIKVFESYFVCSNDGYDIQRFFQQIVNKVNNGTRIKKEIKAESTDRAEVAYKRHQGQHCGFIFDLFYSQIGHKIMCECCNKVFDECFQVLNVYTVSLPTDKGNVSLKDCLDLFLSKNLVDYFDEIYQCCSSPTIISVSEITHVPKYIFIYVIRGSYNPSDDKNRTSVQLNYGLHVPTKYGPVPYKLKALVDHLGGNEYGHYYAKCLHKQWLLCNDTQVEPIAKEDVPSKDSVGFLVERCDNDRIQPKNGASSLVAMVQMLYSCKEFRLHMINYLNQCVGSTASRMSHECTVIELAKLFSFLEFGDILSAEKCMNALRNMVTATGDQNEIFAIFSQIIYLFDFMTQLNDIQDLFKMKFETKTKCSNCDYEKIEYSSTHCISIDLKKYDGEVNLEYVANDFFREKVSVEEKCESKDCNHVTKSILKITKPSKYIFISVVDQGAPLLFDEGLCLQDETYFLRAVIYGDKGQYRVKCRHDDWWLFDRDGARKISNDDLNCKDTIAFMMVHCGAESAENLNGIGQSVDNEKCLATDNY